MALILTHIRFALDVAPYLPVGNIGDYISGTVYPDSRWTTGIDRDLTHHSRFQQADFPTDDFTYGWYVHCWCDELQKKLHEKLFTNLQEMERLEGWTHLTTAKIIQDLHDLQAVDLGIVMDYLLRVRNPNGEDLERVKKFYQVVRQTYQPGKVPTFQTYGELWLNVGLDQPTTTRLLNLLATLSTNNDLVRKVADSYQVTLHQFIKIVTAPS